MSNGYAIVIRINHFTCMITLVNRHKDVENISVLKMFTIGFVTYVDLINTSQRLVSIICCNNIDNLC